MKKCVVLLAIGVLFFSERGQAQQVQQPQAQQAPQAQSRPLGSEFAKGMISPVLSVVYFPLKFSYGTLGAILGGVSGGLTGGNVRAAEGLWRPMTGGTYFITPQIIDRERPFLPFDGGEYAQWPRNTIQPTGSMYTQP
jgi:hypothetical protein